MYFGTMPNQKEKPGEVCLSYHYQLDNLMDVVQSISLQSYRKTIFWKLGKLDRKLIKHFKYDLFSKLWHPDIQLGGNIKS